MMPLPCPSCGQPLGLKLDFLVKHPSVQCPHCYAVMKFDVDKNSTAKMKKGLKQLQDLKKKYESIAKFS
jgi:phage FluMu protein Com|tara:strand:+ start:799 stop:1005 length:207 start_codon:yes stop_codon:yes gene_type:complete